MMVAFKHSARNVLRIGQVLEIFKRKMCDDVRSADGKTQHSLPDANKVGKEFGVSAKAVRDIWTSRTWYRETLPLDPARPDAQERLSKQVGRPKGSKDRKPRRQRETAIIANTPISLPQITVEPTTQFMQRIVTVRDSSKAGITGNMKDGSDQSMIASRSFLDASIFSGLDVSMPGNSKHFGCVEFSDPFHDDWPYWTSKNDVDTITNTTSFQDESTIAQK